jgi:hypothetical protein
VFDPTDGDSGSAENRQDKETCVEEIVVEFNKNEREPIGRLSDLPGAYRTGHSMTERVVFIPVKDALFFERKLQQEFSEYPFVGNTVMAVWKVVVPEARFQSAAGASATSSADAPDLRSVNTPGLRSELDMSHTVVTDLGLAGLDSQYLSSAIFFRVESTARRGDPGS